MADNCYFPLLCSWQSIYKYRFTLDLIILPGLPGQHRGSQQYTKWMILGPKDMTGMLSSEARRTCPEWYPTPFT